MKRVLISLAALAMTAGAASATETWILTKANKEYKVDTVYHATVGPGTTLTHLELRGEYLEQVFYTTVDLTNENVKIRALKAKDTRSGRDNVPVIATSHDVQGEMSHFAGVNSDFFDMSSPYYTNGLSISDGRVMSRQNAAPWAHWMMLEDKTPLIAAEISEAPYVYLADGSCYYFLIGGTRGANELRFYQYDPDKGEGQTTMQNKWGSEVVVEPADAKFPWTSHEMTWRVVSKPTTPNTVVGMAIPVNGFVMSGNGKAATLVASLKEGDTFTTRFVYKADGVDVMPTQVSGGNNILLKNNEPIDINSSNAPRTFVGFDADRTKLVMMVVDGRQDGWSQGVYYRLGAAIMQKVGCTEALEFDGGGSSTMYIKPFGVVNKPSEGALRAVACGVYATAVCPDDWNVTRIEVKEKNVKLAEGETFTPTVYGYNRYGVMIDNNVSDFTLEAPASLGTVSADGKTLTAKGAGYHPLTVRYGMCTTVIPVKLPGDAGIENVAVGTDNSPAEYFNLNGIRIDRPVSGQLYIVRRGNQVTKEVVR